MTSERSNSQKPVSNPDAVIDGEEVEFKINRRPIPNIEAMTVRRVVRQGSKAQWYCSADPKDMRVQKFAKFLRDARTQRGWTQTEAAEECKMTQPQWSNLESGEIEPMPRKVFEIERAFGRDPGEMSHLLGYSPHGGDERELFTKVAERLDDLLVHGAWAVEEVLERDSNSTEVQKFLDNADEIGLDVIAALARVSDKLLDELNRAVDEAMPKVFRMKQAQMMKLSSRLTSFIMEPEETFINEVNQRGKQRIPHPLALKQFEMGWLASPFDEPIRDND